MSPSAVTKDTPFKISGKTAIITGAGSGINLAFASLLLSKGCNVVFADLALRPEAQEVVDAYSKTGEAGARAVYIKTDVVVWDQLERMFQTADDEFGGADIVCPGAGVFEPPWSTFWHPPGTSSSKDNPHGDADTGIGHYATLDINITHPIRVTQLALSRWLNKSQPQPETENATQNNGKTTPAPPPALQKRILHISSVAGQVPVYATPLYAASKHALSGFVRSLAGLDTSLGVRVNAVAPGVVRSPLWTEHPEKLKFVTADNGNGTGSGGGDDADVWVEADEVAEAMVRCLVDSEIGGGVVLEVTKGRTRKVGVFNDPGPSGPGSGAESFRELAAMEVDAWLKEPGWGVSREQTA